MAQHTPSEAAEPSIVEANRAVLGRFPFDDTQDFDDAKRGFLGTAADPLIKSGGRTVWDLEAYGFLSGACPDSVNPSLWRQSRLTSDHGLFAVTEGIYQVRGFDLSNMTSWRASRASW